VTLGDLTTGTSFDYVLNVLEHVWVIVMFLIHRISFAIFILAGQRTTMYIPKDDLTGATS